MVEEINPEQIEQELREAFRLYDKEGNNDHSVHLYILLVEGDCNY